MELHTSLLVQNNFHARKRFRLEEKNKRSLDKPVISEYSDSIRKWTPSLPMTWGWALQGLNVWESKYSDSKAGLI